MQDVKLQHDAQGLFDLVVKNGQIVGVDGLDSVIPTCLFTDNRAPKSLVPNAKNRRGCIANSLGFSLGSIVWCYEQSRLDQNTINGIRQAVQDALAWMIEDSIVKQIFVDVEKTGTREININIETISELNETTPYNYLWKMTNAS